MPLTLKSIRSNKVIVTLVELILWVLLSTLFYCLLLNDNEDWGDCVKDPNNWLMGLFWAIGIIIINEITRFIIKKI